MGLGLNMPNNLLGLMDYVQHQGEIGTARRKANALAQLSGDYAAGGDPDYRAIADNGGNPLAFRDDRQQQEARLREDLGRDAALLLAATPEAREALYQQNLPKYQHFFQAAPPSYTPELDPILQQLAGTTRGGRVQSTYIDADGNRVAIMADGTTQVLGPNAPNNQIIAAADGYYGVDKYKLSADPVRIGGGAPSGTAPASPPAGGGERPSPMQLAGLFQKFGGVFTSGYRDAKHNREVGGVENSQHKDGTGMDFVFPNPRMKENAIGYARANGWEAIDEGDHVHFELPPGADAPQASGPGGILQPRPPATSADDAPKGYRWNADHTALEAIPGGPAQVATDARQAALEAKQAATQLRQSEAAASASQLVSAIDRLTESSGFGDLGTAWGDFEQGVPILRTDAKDAQAQLENIAGQIALTTMARLKSLSAVGATGFGALTAPELKLLQNSLATLQSEKISNEELRNSLKIIRDTMQKIADWKPDSAPAAPSGGSSAPSRYTMGQIIVHNGKRYRVTGLSDPNDPDVEEVR